MIGALDSPTEGRIRIAGRDITNASRKELFEFRRHTGVIVSIGSGSLVAAILVGTAAVALAPLFNTRRVRRMDVPSTLRVVE